MPAPTYTAGTVGNIINAVSVAHGATAAGFLDLSTRIEGQLVCEIVTGSGAPTAGTTFSAYKAYAAGGAPPITFAASASAAATSISVNSSTGLHQGQAIAVQQAGGSHLGEIVTITGAITGSGPYAVPVSALVNAYSTSDAVYLIGQTPVFSVKPASTAGTWAANSVYSSPFNLGTGQYVLAAANGDGTQAVTASVTDDLVPSYA